MGPAATSAETIKSEEQSAALKAARAKFWVIKMLLNTIGGTLAHLRPYAAHFLLHANLASQP
jgi:hypothetical protein